MADRILVGVDGSESASEAVDYACCLAQGQGSEVVALRVVDKRKYLPGFWHGIEATIEKELEAHAIQTLRAARNQARTRGMSIELEIRYGDSAEEICRFVSENEDIVMVVLGISGRGHQDKQAPGYTAEHIAFQVGKKLPCPVLLTPYSGMSEEAGKRFESWCRKQP